MTLPPKKLRRALEGLGAMHVIGEGCDCNRFITGATMTEGVLVLVEEGKPEPLSVKAVRSIINEKKYRTVDKIAVEGCDGCLNLVVGVEARKDSVLLTTVHGLGD